MNRRITTWQALVAILFFLTSCTKIETTSIGDDLIPAVDNVHTFETDLDVVANNYISTETFRLNTTNPHTVGAISQDPVFGKSKATMFFEMKPQTYPYIFRDYDSIKGSKVGFDSAILILNYIGYYGDSIAPVNLKLYEVDRQMIADTAVTPSYTLSPDLGPNKAKLWGSKTITARQLRDSVKIIRNDTTFSVNELRIRLDDDLARSLFYADTFSVYKNDTTFRQYLPGFALEADPSSKTLLYFNIGGTSRIQFFYRANNNAVRIDTTSDAFILTGRSGHAVKFENDFTGATLANYLTPDNENGQDKIFIGASPSTAATIHIKGLDTFKLTNRVIHRAELRITQEAPLDDSQLNPPVALYLDLIDSSDATNVTFRGIPYDLNPLGRYYCFPATSDIDFNYFGGLTTRELVNNNSLSVYRFNIARYLQGIVTRGEEIHDLRLSAPFYMFYKECSNGSNLEYPLQVFPFTRSRSLLNPIGRGRIKLVGSSPTLDESLRMKLRIIYSIL